MDEPVQDSVGEGGFSNRIVPRVDGNLVCDQDRSGIISVFDDFHEVAALAGVQTIRAPIIKDQQRGFGEAFEDAGKTTVIELCLFTSPTPKRKPCAFRGGASGCNAGRESRRVRVIGVDASSMDANAALRNIVRRDTGEGDRKVTP